MFVKIGDTYVNPRSVCRVRVSECFFVDDEGNTQGTWEVVVCTADGGYASTRLVDPSDLVADLESLAEHGKTRETVAAELEEIRIRRRIRGEPTL